MQGSVAGPVSLTVANGFVSVSQVYLAIKEPDKDESVRVRLPIMDLAPTSTLTRMSISWDNSAGYTDVHVYLDGAEKGPVGSNASSYEFSGLSAATTYTVRLELKNPTADAPTLTITKNIPTQSEL